MNFTLIFLFLLKVLIKLIYFLNFEFSHYTEQIEKIKH